MAVNSANPFEEGRASARVRNESASISESEDTIRNLKASESVVSAFQAAGIPSPPADLAAIVTTYVKSATQEIPANQIAGMSPGTGALGASAATGVNMFIGSLTPTQLQAMRAGVNPLDPAAVLKFSAMLMQQTSFGPMGASVAGQGGRISSDSYSRELSGGSVYKSLASAGYSAAQIGSALDFAHQLSVNEEFARKLIKLDQHSRDDLKTFVEKIRNNSALTEKQKKEAVAKFRKEHPKTAKVLTDDDILNIIRGDQAKKVRLDGAQSAIHDTSQKDRVQTFKELGIENGIKAEHAAKIAELSKSPDAQEDISARFARHADRKHQQASADQQTHKAASAEAQDSKVAQKEPSKPDPRQASLSTSQKLTNG